MTTRAELSPTSKNLMSMQWLKRPLEDKPVEIKVAYDPEERKFKLDPAASDNKSFSITLTRNSKEAGPFDSVYHAFTGSMKSSVDVQSTSLTLKSEVTVKQMPPMTGFFINTVGDSSDDPMVLSTTKST